MVLLPLSPFEGGLVWASYGDRRASQRELRSAEEVAASVWWITKRRRRDDSIIVLGCYYVHYTTCSTQYVRSLAGRSEHDRMGSAAIN